jgi:hypothetical protein
MLTVEELQMPRFRVKNTYPGMHVDSFSLGQIITLATHETDGWVYMPSLHNPGSYMRIGFFELFPHLFEPLPWWKERRVEDMPRYIKGKERIYEVTEWRKDMLGWFYPRNKVDGSTKDDTENFANIEWHFFKDQFLPCDEADYNAYLQTTKTN